MSLPQVELRWKWPRIPLGSRLEVLRSRQSLSVATCSQTWELIKRERINTRCSYIENLRTAIETTNNITRLPDSNTTYELVAMRAVRHHVQMLKMYIRQFDVGVPSDAAYLKKWIERIDVELRWAAEFLHLG